MNALAENMRGVSAANNNCYLIIYDDDDEFVYLGSNNPLPRAMFNHLFSIATIKAFLGNE